MLEFTVLQRQNEEAIKSIGYRLEKIHDECTDRNTKLELREFADDLNLILQKLIDEAIDEYSNYN